MNPVVILVSADAEWRAAHARFSGAAVNTSPYGEWFRGHVGQQAIIFHGGWGKIAAAGSTQYAIDRWEPSLLVNLGTCGGFEGRVKLGTVLLAERTLVYDIIEQMSDPDEALKHYTTRLDLSWLGGSDPQPVQRGLLVSGDRDLVPTDIPMLIKRFDAVAGDWESGAIAWVAAHNNVRCLILRGVTDLVGPGGSVAYGNLPAFEEAAGKVMEGLFEALPAWIARGVPAGE